MIIVNDDRSNHSNGSFLHRSAALSGVLLPGPCGYDPRSLAPALCGSEDVGTPQFQHV